MNTFTASYGDASASTKPVEKKIKVKPAVKVEPGSLNVAAAKPAATPAAKPAAGSTNRPAAKPAATPTPEPEKPKFYVKKLGALFTFR